MADPFACELPSLDSPAANFIEVTPSTSELAVQPRFLIVGVEGTLILKSLVGVSVTLTVQAGQVVPLRPTHILPGTTASNIVAAW